MTAEAKKALDRKNREYLAKKKAKREAQAAARAGKKKTAQSGMKDKTAGPQQRKTENAKPADQAKPLHQTVTQADRVARSANATGRVTLCELKERIKERWPKIHGLADATKAELMDVLDKGASEPLFLDQMQTLWESRAKERRECWLRGDSKSAQAVRTKQNLK